MEPSLTDLCSAAAVRGVTAVLGCTKLTFREMEGGVCLTDSEETEPKGVWGPEGVISLPAVHRVCFSHLAFIQSHLFALFFLAKSISTTSQPEQQLVQCLLAPFPPVLSEQ